MEQKLKETYCYNHKGISVFVKVDYRNNRIDLVEPKCDGATNFKLKQWMFGNRGVEYVNGWLLILEAMGEAMKDAKKKMEKNLAETSKFKDNLVRNVMEKIGSELKKELKKK